MQFAFFELLDRFLHEIKSVLVKINYSLRLPKRQNSNLVWHDTLFPLGAFVLNIVYKLLYNMYLFENICISEFCMVELCLETVGGRWYMNIIHGAHTHFWETPIEHVRFKLFSISQRTLNICIHSRLLLKRVQSYICINFRSVQYVTRDDILWCCRVLCYYNTLFSYL